MKTAYLGIVFVVLLAVGYFAARYIQVGAETALVVEVDDCDLAATACEGGLPDGTLVRLSVLPRPIPLMVPLRVEVQAAGGDWVPRRLDITGLNMEMGLNRTSLKPDSEGRWQGETILPTCSQRRMHWQASLLLEEGGDPVQLRFRFFTERP